MPKKKIFRKIAFLHFDKHRPYRIFLNFALIFSLFCKKNNAQKIIGGHHAYF